MHYILESLIVGLYSGLIYLVLKNVTSNIQILLLIVGFSKHYLGSYARLHNYYCNYGYACKKIDYDHAEKIYQIMKAKDNNLLFYSVGEAILYSILGNVYIHFYFGSSLSFYFYLFFIIGFTLHIIFEVFGFHQSYCKDNCISST